MNLSDLDTFVDAYIDCALWSSTDDDGHSLEDFDGELTDKARGEMADDCRSFVGSNLSDLADLDAGQCGHDFWLTRNRHGAGFWDRGLGDVGARLTKASHAYGSCDLYTDGEQIHVS